MDGFNQLIPALKSLRLSGVLDTLELRNQQAVKEKATYVEFLQRLLEDEVERRNNKQLDLRLRRSNLEPTKTLESFDFAFNPDLNRQQVYDLWEALHEVPSLVTRWRLDAEEELLMYLDEYDRKWPTPRLREMYERHLEHHDPA